MEAVGVVVEYNPFHNGHFYHLQMAKKISKAEIVIAVMSGNFLQRGEPALVSKWSRTKMALQAGVDLVIELPYVFSVQKADNFSYGAVYLLNALKCRSICFGSESGSIDDFYHTYRVIQEHKETYEENIRALIKTGVSYPKALSQAFEQIISSNKSLVDLSKPNNILGYQYLVAAMKINPNLTFYTIERKNSHYHDKIPKDAEFASATAIRNMLENTEDMTSIQNFVPDFTMNELLSYKTSFGQFHHWKLYWPLLQYRILSMSIEELQNIYDVEEGLENRIKKAALTATDFHSFMNQVKTKRYTWTRLQRICIHILTNTYKQDILALEKSPAYARLLGMSGNGRLYLSKIKKELDIPVISKLSQYEDSMLEKDIKATYIYAQGLEEPARSKLRSMEFNQPPIRYGW